MHRDSTVNNGSAGTFRLILDGSPILATAIHDGHEMRREASLLVALNEDQRLREKDPFTSEIAKACGSRIVALRSRFEVDLNRPREKAVYLTPEDAWGLDVWKQPPSAGMIRRSLAIYDSFYRTIGRLLRQLVREHGRVVVLDLHSYNHRRGGAACPVADPAENPEINIGTGTMNRRRWQLVVDRFISDLRAFRHSDHPLDVRENVRFRGGELCRWIHTTFPGSVCAIAIEFRKSFMDEWTGQPVSGPLSELTRALRSTRTGLLDSLDRLKVGFRRSVEVRG